MRGEGRGGEWWANSGSELDGSGAAASLVLNDGIALHRCGVVLCPRPNGSPCHCCCSGPGRLCLICSSISLAIAGSVGIGLRCPSFLELEELSLALSGARGDIFMWGPTAGGWSDGEEAFVFLNTTGGAVRRAAQLYMEEGQWSVDRWGPLLDDGRVNPRTSSPDALTRANAGEPGGMGLTWMTIHGSNRKTQDRGPRIPGRAPLMSHGITISCSVQTQ